MRYEWHCQCDNELQDDRVVVVVVVVMLIRICDK